MKNINLMEKVNGINSYQLSIRDFYIEFNNMKESKAKRSI